MNSAKAPKDGKFLSFFLGREEYAVDIEHVQEIANHVPPSPFPGPKHLLGEITIRGRSMPVIDLKMKLGLGRSDGGPFCCLIVLNSRTINAALLVDRVHEVAELSVPPQQPPEDEAAGFASTAKKDGRPVMILHNLAPLLR